MLQSGSSTSSFVAKLTTREVDALAAVTGLGDRDRSRRPITAVAEKLGVSQQRASTLVRRLGGMGIVGRGASGPCAYGVVQSATPRNDADSEAALDPSRREGSCSDSSNSLVEQPTKTDTYKTHNSISPRPGRGGYERRTFTVQVSPPVKTTAPVNLVGRSSSAMSENEKKSLRGLGNSVPGRDPRRPRSTRPVSHTRPSKKDIDLLADAYTEIRRKSDPLYTPRGAAYNRIAKVAAALKDVGLPRGVWPGYVAWANDTFVNNVTSGHLHFVTLDVLGGQWMLDKFTSRGYWQCYRWEPTVIEPLLREHGFEPKSAAFYVMLARVLMTKEPYSGSATPRCWVAAQLLVDNLNDLVSLNAEKFADIDKDRK